MKGAATLAIATAGPVGAALLFDDDAELAVATTEQALSGALRCVRDVLAAADADIGRVALVAACTGPGSFTGLRIGVALAKSIAQARDLPMIGVSSYDVVDEDGAPYPRIALVEGKRDFYYARAIDDPSATPRFLSGSREELTRDLASRAARDLADLSAGEQASRIAHIARRRAAAGGADGWQAVDIEYGGRPNAVVNWEHRRLARESGGSSTRGAARRTPRT